MFGTIIDGRNPHLQPSVYLWLKRTAPSTADTKVMAPVVNLHVTLLDKSQGTAVAGSASLDTCVWKLGEQVGMQLGPTTGVIGREQYASRVGLIAKKILTRAIYHSL